MNSFPKHESSSTISFRERVRSLLGRVTRETTTIPDPHTELNPAFAGLDPSKKWLLVDFGEGGGVPPASVEEQEALDELMQKLFDEDLAQQ